MKRVRSLYIGGCPAPYHRLEPTVAPVRSALEGAGISVDVTGIYHPDGGDDWVGDYSMLTPASLEEYGLIVVFTTGKETRGADLPALERWVRAGGAFAGIHCAADSFTDNPDYIAMLGGKFRTHPAQLDIALEIVDAAHPVMQGIEPFTVHDELYLFSDYAPSNVHLLAQTVSFDDDGPVPLCWTREPGDGRLFYLSLGHNPTTMEHRSWQQLFIAGVEWALKRR